VIGIVDYGSGNIQAIANIYGQLHLPFVIATKPEDLEGVKRVLLPGVGAFDQAMNALNHSGLRAALDHIVLERKTPVLGICVGMQLLAKRSEEGVIPGLGWVDAEVKRFVSESVTPPLRLPHMGWNDVRPAKETPLFRNVDLGNGYYFLHSFYVECARQADVLAVTSYGTEFACAVSAGNIHGVQFHPEKSHAAGIQLLKNFAEL
jgi:glutamine amidotransferase